MLICKRKFGGDVLITIRMMVAILAWLNPWTLPCSNSLSMETSVPPLSTQKSWAPAQVFSSRVSLGIHTWKHYEQQQQQHNAFTPALFYVNEASSQRHRRSALEMIIFLGRELISFLPALQALTKLLRGEERFVSFTWGRAEAGMCLSSGMSPWRLLLRGEGHSS